MSVHEQVRHYLSQVRRRLQAQTAARGLGIAGVVALAATIVAVLGANAWRFSDSAMGYASLFLWVALLGALAWFLARPLLRRSSDQRIAQFVEEKHPEFKDRLVTAVELNDKSAADPAARVFRELVAEDALRRAPSAPPSELVQQRRILRPLVWAGGSVAVILLLGMFGPGIFRYGTRALWIGWAQADSTPLYSIQVTPGDIVIGRNADQEVTALPVGFQPGEMRLFVQYEKSPSFESAPMVSSEQGGRFHFLLMNVQEKLDYYVESNGVRSPKHTISVIQVPRVERLEVHYRFPAYAAMEDRIEPGGGDIMALKGTEVTLTVHTDTPSSGGRLALDDRSSIELKASGDKQLQAKWTLTQDTLYHVRLEDPQGREARASEEYLMQAILDLGPSVRLVRPGRDLQPTPVEEVVISFEAQDDVRLAGMTLNYSVNGSALRSVPLSLQGGREQTTGSHLLPLEEYSLAPGDLITYYGTAKDAASNELSTEMYFLQVRPFERNYVQSQSGGGGGGGGGQQPDTFLSERQKEVIAATWNVIRQKDKQEKEANEDAAKVLGEAQRELREQAQTLAGRIGRRELDGVNDEFAKLAENLEKAAEAMEQAAGQLEGQKFQDALTPEQTALQHLLRAEASFKDIQVAFGNQGGGGGGGGGAGRDLSDLFSLELDTSKNQYETLNQYQGGQSNASVQEAMNKLQELARRQQELARQQNQKDSLRAADRWEQEMLRREAEQLARELEQLSRQNNSSQLAQAGRSVSQAARDMQQANQQGGQPGQQGQQGQQQNGQQSGQQSGQPGQQGQQGGQQGQPGQQQSSGDGSTERERALQRLRDASSMLSGQQNQWDEQRIQELGNKAGELERLQQQIAERTNRMASESEKPSVSSQEMRENLSELINDKVEMLEGLRNLESQLSQSAARMAGDQKDAAKDLREASSMIQEERMADKVRQGAWLSQRGLWPTAQPLEEELRAGIGRMADQIEQAQRAFQAGGGGDDKMQRALETAERVRQGLESMASSRGQQGQQQQGQGQQGQQGQRGQQGQQGQQGQGQQGQQGQGQQPGQQGQPGQGQQAGQQGQGSAQGGSSGMRSGNPAGGYGDGQAGSYAGGAYRGSELNPGGFTPNGPYGQLTPEQRRGLEEEYRGLRQEAGEMRELLGQDPEFGRLVAELVRDMQNLNWGNFQADPAMLERMQGELTDRWKDLELRLRRELQMEEPESVRMSNQERVPERYRSIVEEYYRSLSRTPR